jgi:hypothetical protein
MNKNLYFVQIIAEALQAPEPRQEIKKAFEKIKHLGQQPEYHQGYLQFQQFMEQVLKSDIEPELISQQILMDAVFQLATGLIPEDSMEGKKLLEVIKTNPILQEEFDRVSKQALQSETGLDQLELIVEKNGLPVGSFPIKSSVPLLEMRGITPGTYEVRLNTGRVLWQADLREEDLLWSAAFPEEALDLAADTGESFRRITKEFTILGGEITIRVYPEIESGRIEVEVRDSQFEK